MRVGGRAGRHVRVCVCASARGQAHVRVRSVRECEFSACLQADEHGKLCNMNDTSIFGPRPNNVG